MKNEIIRAENVSKIYPMGDVEVKALDKVTFSLFKGDYVAIMGPSGSGKTTLLDVLSVLSRPTHGEVFIKGRAVSEMNDNELAQVRGKTVGFVFQTFNLISRMTAKQNVMLPLWFQGIPRHEREEIAERALEEVGLDNRADHRPGELSGGQRQRTALARALAVNPEIIVADEPTGNLDSESGAMIMKLFNSLHKKGKTILMVTHDPEIAKHAFNRVHLRDGQIIGKRHGKKRALPKRRRKK